jgi:hypothetical protein
MIRLPRPPRLALLLLLALLPPASLALAQHEHGGGFLGGRIPEAPARRRLIGLPGELRITPNGDEESVYSVNQVEGDSILLGCLAKDE